MITDHTTSDIHVPPTQPEQTQSINHQNPAITNGNETVTATPSPWANPTPELKVQTRTIYTQVVHCKPVFMILATKRVGFNFIETLIRTLNSLIETYAIKTKSEKDGLKSKTIARRIKQWHKSELDELFDELGKE